MFQLHLYHELSSTQFVSSHYTPSFLHISEMMMNVTMTLQPTAEYSTHLHALLFSTFFLLLFSSTISLPPPASSCAYFFVFPFPLLFFVDCILYTRVAVNSEISKMRITSSNKRKQLSTITSFFLSFNFSLVAFIFLLACHLLINT